MNTRIIFILLLACVLLWVLPITLSAQEAEEFNGPFSSWADVKKRFKAKGDGKADDTRALQTALDSLYNGGTGFNTGNRAYAVVYIPAGTYRITNTLVLRGQIGVQIIGEDPVNTRIVWAGGNNDTMFWANGSAYFKLSRITFDAGNKKGISCIGLHWKERWAVRATKTSPASRSFASLYNEFSDLIFEGQPAVGINGGTVRTGSSPGTGANDSEITIRRCIFNECAEAGVKISGHNALEYWIWDSKFFQCGTGVLSSLGNFHLYRSFFQQSVIADISQNHGYYTSARFCYSENSKSFSIDAGASSNPFKRTFQGNIISNTQDIPVKYTHVGRITLFDNEVTASRNELSPYMVTQQSWAPASYQILSIGNKYGHTKTPLRIGNANQKIFRVTDTALNKPSVSARAFLAKMPATPKKTNRKIFVVPAGADDKIIQQIINQAAAQKGSRPVVHFPVGQYTLNKTVVIPEGSDMQITGDGLRYTSVIKFGKPETFEGRSLFKIPGPSYVSFRDIQLGTFVKFKWKAIEFENIDQQEAFVKFDQIYTIADTCLFINGLDHTYFEKNNSFFADGNVIKGGILQKAGKGNLRLYTFGGQFARTEVTNNAVFAAKDCWWEGPQSVPLNFRGDGQISIESAKIAPRKTDSLPIISIDEFKGRITLMNMYVQGGIRIKANNPDLKFLFWNAHIFFKKDILSTIPIGFTGQLAYLGLTGQCMYKDDPWCKRIWSVENKTVNVKKEENFLLEMTRLDRESVPREFVQRSKGASSIYFSRVLFDSFEIALQFNGKKSLQEH